MSTPTNTIILLSLPPKTFIGINLSTFSSSPNFHGINKLPPGLHFLYTGTDASLSIRHGYWLNIPTSSRQDQGTQHVFKWNTEGEHLDLLESTSHDAQSAVRGLFNLTRGLVDYTALREASVKLQDEQTRAASQDNRVDEDEDRSKQQVTHSNGNHAIADADPWHGLVSHISPRLLDRILSRHTVQEASDIAGSSNNDESITSWTLTSISSAPGDSESIPGLSDAEVDNVLNPTHTLDLLSIDLKKTWDETDLGRVRTERARDRSWYLAHLITILQTRVSQDSTKGAVSKEVAAKDFLGEIQFTFLMVLCLANYSCLEQWKRLLSVLFTCQIALSEVEGFFVEAVSTLRSQLGRVEDVEGGLFEMADEAGSAWLRRLLKAFRNNVDEGFKDGGGGKLKEALQGLDDWLRETYGWEDEKNVLRRGMVQLEDGEMVELQADGLDEDEETGEYAPAIVEM